MNAPETITSTLFSRLVKARQAVTVAKKSAMNDHFDSKYADLPSVIEVANAALHPNGLAFLQDTEDKEHGITVVTIIISDSGESMRIAPVYVPASKENAHGYGSAITYGRRYSLQTALGIPADDDDGNGAAATAPEKPAKPKSVARDAFDNLPPEDQEYLSGLAMPIKAHLSVQRLREAVDLYHAATQEIADSDPGFKAAFWSRFDSKERAFLRDHTKPMETK